MQALFIRPADIFPDKEAGTLNVRVHGAATHSENLKLNALFRELNGTETVFPLTNLKMVFELLHGMDETAQKVSPELPRDQEF